MATSIDDLSNKFGRTSVKEESSALYYPLVMNIDKKTEMYVKFAKVMIIFQGSYDQQRFSAIDTLKKKFRYASRILSDYSYMSECRQSKCDYTKTEEFDSYFKTEAKNALEQGNNLLVIDATMSNKNQNMYYMSLAHAMQYVVLVIPPFVSGPHFNTWPKNSLAESFSEARARLQPTNMFEHLFCGWFLHDIDSYELRHEAELYINDCIKEVPEFKKLFMQILNYEIDNDCDFEDMNYVLMDHIKDYFHFEDQNQHIAYCVTKVFANMRAMIDYFKKPCVSQNYGKMSKLLIAGFIISPLVVAARVKITHNQRELWEMPETLEEKANMPLCPSKIIEDSVETFPKIQNLRKICSKSNRTVINSGKYIDDPLTESFHKNKKYRACHIMVGKADSASYEEADFTVQHALHRESLVTEKVETYDLERSIVKKIGKYTYIYLKEMISVDAFFTSYCKPSDFGPFNYKV